MANKNDTSLFDCLEKNTPLPQKVTKVEPNPGADKNTICCTIDSVLSLSECQAVIERSETVGFETALLNVGGGRQVLATDLRNSDRVIIDDATFAQALYHRIRHLLPRTYFESAPAVGLNERLRVLRYGPGQDFKLHSDGCYARPDGSECSYWTVMLYLNSVPAGGATAFYKKGKKVASIQPQPGSVLVFDHTLGHEGEKVKQGLKYALRTDMMFSSKKTGEQHDGESDWFL